MGTVLKPILQPTPGTPPTHNFGLCETFSYIPVEGAGRPLYARASYITNFSDMSIHLSAGELSIGAVTIKDNNTGLNCDVVSDPANGLNALRVISQDSESAYDSITLGDRNGINFAAIDGNLSALNVKITNLSSLDVKISNSSPLDVTVINLSSVDYSTEAKQDSMISLLNVLTAKEYIFQVNAENLVLPDDTNILFDTTPIEIPLIQLTQVDYSTSTKQNTIITLLEQLTAQTNSLKDYTQNLDPLLNLNHTLLNSLTTLEEKEFYEIQNLLNSLTALQDYKQNSQIDLLNTLSSQNFISLYTLSSLLVNTQDLEISFSQTLSSLPSQITTLSSIDSNTNQLKTLLTVSNTLLNELTSKEIVFNTVPLESKLSFLTSINFHTEDIKNLLETTNTLLNELTAKETNISITTSNTLLNQLTSLEATNSQQTITLLQQLTASEGLIEPLLVQSNNLVESLTSQNLEEFKKVHTLLHSLTSINYSTALQQLTSNTDELESLISRSNTLVNSLTSLQQIEFNEAQNLLNTQNSLISSLGVFVSTNSVKVSSSSLENLLQIVNTKLDSLITRSDQQLGLMGLDVLESGMTHIGYWTTLTVISLSAKFLSLGAINSSTANLSGYELPLTFTLSGPLTSIKLEYGAVIAYH